MYEYNYVDPMFLGGEEFGAVYYDICIIEGENEWLESRCVWMVPAPCYPEPDVGAIIDALRHAR